MKSRMEISLTARDVADLCRVPASTIDRLTLCGIHPPWRWVRPMKEPRWCEGTISDWLHILDDVDLDSLPQNPPPLRRLNESFEKPPVPSAEELRVAAHMLGLPAEYAAVG